MAALAAVSLLAPARALAHGAPSDDAYVLFLDTSSVTMSGSMGDLAHARSLRSKRGQPVLWFRQSGTEYLVTDPSVLHAVAEADGNDAELDAKQEDLERRVEGLDDRIEDLNDRKDELADRDDDKESTRRAVADLTREISERSAELDRLSARQDALGKEVERAAAEADHRIREILERSIASGAARPVGASKP